MTKIRITKEFKFEMAHALLDYDGPCKNIHGHSYILYVTLIGEPIQKKACSDAGMVMDFSALKNIVRKEIIDRLDHALVLNEDAPNSMKDALQAFDNVILLPYQPTCENLILDFVDRLKKLLPPGTELHSLRLHETASSYAEWFAADNV